MIIFNSYILSTSCISNISEKREANFLILYVSVTVIK